jgi:hypothetical protein
MLLRTSILIFKHYIFLVVYFYLGNFQFITPAYAAFDGEETCISTSKLDGNSYKQIETGQITVHENCNPALKTETYAVDEVPSEQGHEAISLDSVTVNEYQLPMIDDTSSKQEEYIQIQTHIPTKSEVPVYQKTDEIGGDWVGWIKWFFFFVILTVTLTPFTLIQFSRNAAVIYAAGAFVGSAQSKVGAIKGAANGIRATTVIFFIGIFLGPYGMLYCIYHPLQAFFSDADRTYCCTMTWLGDTTISKKAISADGHWLAEVQEQMPEYLGLGDKHFVEKNVLSVMNLTTGKHVRWAQSGQKLLGINPDESQIQEIVINEGIWIRPANYLTGEDLWYRVQLKDNFLRPLNSEQTGRVKVHYQLLGSEDQQEKQLQFVDVNAGQVFAIETDMKYDRHYLSYDGRVVALVQGPPKVKSTDGLISQLITMASSYISESWKIEFWHVATGEKIATYSGHGINDNAWILDKSGGSPGHTRFLESSQDGRFWYMIKNDGYIHVFDMSKHIPSYASYVS